MKRPTSSALLSLPRIVALSSALFFLAINLFSSPVPSAASSESEVAPPNDALANAALVPEASLAQACSEPMRFLEADKGKTVALASYPGSGNTWLRHLIEQGSRVYTGSAYKDKSLRGEYPGEGVRDSTVIVAKTHFPCAGCWEVKGVPATEKQTGRVDGKAVVLLLRNPFDAILSEFNRKQSGLNHTGVVEDETLLHSSVFASFVRFRVPSWRYHTQWYRTLSDVYIVYYERLLQRPREELARLFGWLKRLRPLALKQLDPQAAADCALGKDPQGHFRRSKIKAQDPFSWTPPDATESLRQWACKELIQVWNAKEWGPCVE